MNAFAEGQPRHHLISRLILTTSEKIDWAEQTTQQTQLLQQTTDWVYKTLINLGNIHNSSEGIYHFLSEDSTECKKLRPT